MAETAEFLSRAERNRSRSPQTSAPAFLASDAVENMGLKVSVYTKLGEIENTWREFETKALSSPFQHFDFVSAWFENIGIHKGYSPYIIVATDLDNKTAFIFPMMLRQRFFCRVISWAGEKHANYNLGMFCRGWMRKLDHTHIRLIFRAAKEVVGFDSAHLLNQPEAWDDHINPFISLPHFASPSFAYLIDFRPGFDQYLETFRTSKFRKRLRWQERILQKLGKVEFRRARTREEATAFLNVHFAQKSSRFLAIGRSDPFAEPGSKSFLLDLATRNPEASDPPLEIHALFLNDEFLSIYGGATSEGRFSAFFNSINIDAVKQVSFGDMILARLIADCDARHLDGLDLGIGEANYKKSWCNKAEILFDSFLTMSLIGQISSSLTSLARRLKRKIKQTPRLWKIAEKFV